MKACSPKREEEREPRVSKDNEIRLRAENQKLKSALNGLQSREALLDHLINYANKSRDSSVSVQYLQMIRVRGTT